MTLYALVAVGLLRSFDPLDDQIVDVLRIALRDRRFFVRWLARYALFLHERYDVVAEEAHHAHWPPTPPAILTARVQTIESLISSAGDGIDPRITPHTAAVQRREPHGASTRHALPHGDGQTLCRIPRDAVERISALFVLDDDRSCAECQAVAREART